MTESDELYSGLEIDDDLSSDVGHRNPRRSRPSTPGFDNAPGAPTGGLQTEVFAHHRYLKVERSATLQRSPKLESWDGI